MPTCERFRSRSGRRSGHVHDRRGLGKRQFGFDGGSELARRTRMLRHTKQNELSQSKADRKGHPLPSIAIRIQRGNRDA